MWYLKRKTDKESRFSSIKNLEQFFEEFKKEHIEFADIVVFKCSNYLVINSLDESRMENLINEANQECTKLYGTGFLDHFKIHK